MEESRTRQLIQRAQKGDARARNELVTENVGLVMHYAKRFYHPGAFMDMEDLRQQGCLGLMQAIKKFDVHRKARGRRVPFALYARYWIEHAIRREIENRGHTVAMPSYVQWLVHSVEKSGGRGHADYGPWRDPPGLARTLGVSLKRLKILDHAVREVVPFELASEDEAPLFRRLLEAELKPDDPERLFDGRVKTRHLRRLLRRLPSRERYVIQRCYGLLKNKPPMTLREIGCHLGVSEERARQIKKRALLRMRRLLQGHEVDADARSKISRRQWVPMVAAWR